MADHLNQSVLDLEKELAWFRRVLDIRLKNYFGQESEFAAIFEIPPPVIECSTSNWGQFIQKYKVSFAERLTLLLGLIPHLEPRILDVFFTKNAQFDRAFTEFGGRKHIQHQGFMPTGETALFLLAGTDLNQRLQFIKLFHQDHFFYKDQILQLEQPDPASIPMSGALSISKEYLAYFTHGALEKPAFGKDFPAKVINTPLEWSDLVLNAQTLQQVREVETWMQQGKTLLHEWGMQGKIRSGFRALFYGQPGTGKTTTASLLGKSTGREVYRIDLPLVTSKFIGETEKNLAKIFRQAESKQWILFFDEADALFGKRSDISSSAGRYANLEVAYLLQRIEHFEGVVILAANQKVNMDEAFVRRFETIIHFPNPSIEERYRIWKQGIPSQAQLDESVDLKRIAEQYDLTGGEIMDAIRYAALESLRNGSKVITLRTIQQGVRRGLVKSGKLL